MKWRSIAATIAASTVIAFAGALSGTMAWYAYATRASLSYDGTSVYSNGQLQIGLKTPYSTELDTRSNYTVSQESGEGFLGLRSGLDAALFDEIIDVDTDHDGNKDVTYWFMQPSSALPNEVIDRYLVAMGGAEENNHLLSPVTTRQYDGSQDFHLYRAPQSGTYDLGDAFPYTYKKIDFAFRIIKTDTQERISNQDIWMVDTSFHASGDVNGAVRLYMEGNRVKRDGSSIREDTKTLFNPSMNSAGSTKVAGLLDLNGDGYYDFANDAGDYELPGKEIVYGVGDTSSVPTHTFTSDDYTGVNPWEYDNINSYPSVTSSTPKNTFYAKHKLGNQGYVDYSGFTMPEAQYLGKEEVYPEDASGKLSGGRVLTSTSSDALAVADLKMYIYLEGWDHSVIDQNLEHQFNLGLTFQINKVE